MELPIIRIYEDSGEKTNTKPIINLAQQSLSC